MTPVQLAKAYLEDHIEVTAAFLLPGGKKDGAEWRGMRKSQGGPGDSISIHIAKDDKIGMCSFFASGEPGTRDIVATWMRLRGIADKDWKRFFDDMAAFAGTDFGYGTNGQKSPKAKPFADWDKCVAAVTDHLVKELSDWRGLSIDYVTWLRDEKLIGRFRNCWAFPVITEGKLTSIHYRIEPKAVGYKVEWAFEPTGFSNALFVVGDLVRAKYVHVFESQWDLLAVDDVLKMPEESGWALVSTRGVDHAKLLSQLPETIKGIKLWPQADEAGQKWLAKAIGFANGRVVKVAKIPAGFKDANDWIKAGAAKAEVEAVNRDAAVVESPPPKPEQDTGLQQAQDEKAAAEEERLQAFLKATVKGSELLAIQIPPRQLIIKDWLREGDLGFIFAYRGTGKTWLSVALMSALAEGLVCGPWNVHEGKQWPVLYVDGEMPADDIRGRIKAINGGEVPDNFHLFNHEILYNQSELVINLASATDQRLITKVCAEKRIKVLVLDNLGCLFTGVGENDADEWEKVLPWLLELRRAKVTVIIIHHTGVNTTRMRGTSKREDAAAWVMRLDDKKEGTDEPGAKFITRFIKYRGSEVVLDYEWTIKPTGNVISVGHTIASRFDVLMQWVRDGVDTATEIAAEMGISPGQVSKLATKLIEQNRLRKDKRHYEEIK
jgi:AAA domain/Toprim-like